MNDDHLLSGVRIRWGHGEAEEALLHQHAVCRRPRVDRQVRPAPTFLHEWLQGWVLFEQRQEPLVELGQSLAVPLGKPHTATGSAHLRRGSTRGGVSIHDVLQAWRQGWRVHRGGGSRGLRGLTLCLVRSGEAMRSAAAGRQSFSAPPTGSFTLLT
ncbi:hypothetical protein E2C01_089022 [Portunus trituberculatus]|uniref:Uncharacterized protein n=1 Tax=Portunus trituberculatus TaxID=210409 RepID=A0A5B7JL42_PORTR|nr:hypothetical protein [Portunus trituberculatus]